MVKDHDVSCNVLEYDLKKICACEPGNILYRERTASAPSEGRRAAPEVGDLVAVAGARRRSRAAGRWQLSHGYAEETGAGNALQPSGAAQQLVTVSTSPSGQAHRMQRPQHECLNCPADNLQIAPCF